MKIGKPVRKVLLFCTNSDEAGAPRHCEQIVNFLSAEIDFCFVSGFEGAVFRRIRERNIGCFRLKDLKAEISLWRDLIALIKFIRLVRRVRPDIIHTHSAKAGIIGRITGWMLGIQTIHTVHGFPWRGMGWFKKGIIILIEFVLARLPNIEYVFVNEEMLPTAERLLRLRKRNIRRIYNGVSDHSLSKPRKESLKTFIQTTRMSIVFPARVCDAKDHRTFAIALSKVKTPLSITFCGAGTDREQFLANVESLTGETEHQIKFLGERQDARDLIAVHDVTVLASHFEALPLSLIEAMAAGKPVIATNIGGVSELVNAQTGFLCRPGEPDDIANAIHHLTSKQLRLEMGASARAFYEQRFTTEQMCSHLKEMYFD